MTDEQRPTLRESDPAEFVQRAGHVVRVTTRRAVDGHCLDCATTYSSTGTAASHSRAARHRVAVHYSTVFTFAPRELLDGAK